VGGEKEKISIRPGVRGNGGVLDCKKGGRVVCRDLQKRLVLDRPFKEDKDLGQETGIGDRPQRGKGIKHSREKGVGGSFNQLLKRKSLQRGEVRTKEDWC